MTAEPNENHGSKFVASVHLTSGPGYEQSIRAGRHRLIADEPPALGGKDAGASPFQLVLAGLGACTSITLAMYAERKGWDLGPVRIDLRMFEEAGVHRIERIIVFDPRVTEEQSVRLLEIADKTPVTKVVRAGATITTTGSRA